MTRSANAFLLAPAMLALLVAGPILAQQPKPEPTLPGSSSVYTAETGNDETSSDEPPAIKEARRQQAKDANVERQANLKRDTNRLLELATQLKSEVDKTDENILSLGVIKKAEEIEKLARSVRERMKSD